MKGDDCMAKRKYVCPHCGKPIRSSCHTKNANYFDCDSCKLRYRIQNDIYVYEYTPTTRNRVIFKGVNYYDTIRTQQTGK